MTDTTGGRQRATRITLITHASPPTSRSSRFGHGAADPDALRRLQATPAGRFAGLVLRSPSEAAAQTALALHLTAAKVDDALDDRAYGVWTDRTLGDVAEAEPDAFSRWLTDADAAPSGGESVTALLARAQVWLDGFTRVQDRIVAVTHPPVVRACLVAALGALPAVWFRLEIGFCTQCVLTHAGTHWRVALVNAPLI